MKRLNKQLQSVFNFKRFYTRDALQNKPVPSTNSDDLKIHLPTPEYNIDFLCDPSNRDLLARNIKKRKCNADIDKVLNLYQSSHNDNDEILNEIKKIPNLTDPNVMDYDDDQPCVLKKFGTKQTYNFKPQEFSNLMTKLKLLKTDRLGPVTGSKSYVLIDDLAELEQALIKYTIKELLKNNFQLVSVPDILPSQVIERCGLINDGERNLVYQLEPYYGDDYSLSGTAEMALAYKLANKIFSTNELPLKLAAVSRCYRAEISGLAGERGIYRVHQFTKVEMFVCSEQNKSVETMNEIVELQEKLFGQLGLHYQVLDMPPNELGAPAYRKIDIESWMPGRQLFGEISSCSNCTDYQSRRLNIKYKTRDGQKLHVHTLNGTACAVPRMLIAICETHQKKDSNIAIPEFLVPFMNGKLIMSKSNVPTTKTFKGKHKQ